MSLDFLLHYGGRRLRQYVEQPALESPGAEDDDQERKVALDFELPVEDWQPRSVADGSIDPAALPQRFIDGCHYGQTAAWLRDPFGHPIPVRLAEIGGVCMHAVGGSLRRQFVRVERIVSLIVDAFPKHEVEDFAQALTALDMHLLPALPPMIDDARQLTFDYASMEQRTYTQAQVAMRILEKSALAQEPEMLSLVDGPLGRLEHARAIGVVKQQRMNYLGAHAPCWQVFYNLQPGQRTPAFRLASQSAPVVSWFLKLQGAHGAMPNWGIVRLEITRAHFESQASDFDYLDRLSNALLHLRCRQDSYARAPVSMEPIVRAEESLKSLLASPATLVQHFYHLTGL